MPQRGRNTENGTRGELYEYKVLPDSGNGRQWQAWQCVTRSLSTLHSPGLPLATVTGYSGPRGVINWDQGGEQ